MSSIQNSIISVKNLSKVYNTGLAALKNINFDIKRGEIFALLGPNGAGKTTLIGAICGLLKKSSGSILVDGENIDSSYRSVRRKIGLVPQELFVDSAETPWNVASFSRGLFGYPKSNQMIEQLLKSLSLWDKKDSKIRHLSGGMKRRVMIAKALAHEPSILFLDEPTAGVDVALRKDMWDLVRSLRQRGATIILTTHYIEEAQEMADRIGIINHGELVLVEEKETLLRRLGRKRLSIYLTQPLSEIPSELQSPNLSLLDGGFRLVYSFDSQSENPGVADFILRLGKHGIAFKDLATEESSLEEIFMTVVSE